jgi:hypothetical protein
VRTNSSPSPACLSIARLAQALNTTTAHAIHRLSRHPVDWSPPRFRRTQHTATRIGNGAPGTNKTTTRSRTSLTEKEPASPPRAWH